VNPRFLYYRLRLDDFFDYVILTSKGTKMPRGDKTAIMNFELEVPKLEIQNKVVKIIESIEKKVKLSPQIGA
jgi:type I restriction enzyme S subunit